MPESLETVPLLSDNITCPIDDKEKACGKGNTSYWFHNSNNDCTEQINAFEKRKGTTSSIKSPNYPPLKLWQKVLLFISSSYLIFIAGGFLTGLGNIYAEMIRTLGVSRTEASLVQSLTRAITYGAGMISGMLLKRYGNTRCIFTGTLLSTAGLVISSFMTNIIVISICTGVITGCGLSLLLISSYTSVSGLFSHNPELGLNLVSVGFGVGNIAFPAGTELLIEFASWNGTLLICGGLTFNCLVACCIIYVFLDKRNPTTVESKQMVPVFEKSIFKNPYFFILLPATAFVGLTLQVETYFLVDHVVVLGFDRSSGAYLLTIAGVVGLICRMGEGFMFIKFNTNSISHLTVAMFVLGCSHLMLTLLEDYWSIFGAMLLYGMGYSVYSAVLSPFTAEVVGIEQFSVGYGVLISVLGVGFAISGVVGGMLYDITGSYAIVFLSATGFTFIVFLIFLALCFKLEKRPTQQYTKIYDE